MNKHLLILLFCLPNTFALANNKNLPDYKNMPVIIDTVPINLAIENKIIDEVVNSNTPPKKDKVQYVNQVTKYGFKNLFTNYSYNKAAPYINQVNPNAESFVQDYIKAHGSYLQKMKSWGLPYFNLIENILKQYGLPKELKYIAVIESNLSVGATSIVGAGGPWQFMPPTARNFGLVVNAAVDERRDYYKSTHAAAKYLLILYKQLNDWLLVMAAYNGGLGRVNSAIKKSGSRDFWRLQYNLPEESRTYVKRFIATHFIMEGGGGETTVGAGNASYNETINRTEYASGNNSNNNNLQKLNLTAAETAAVEILPISGKYNGLIITKSLKMETKVFNHFNPLFDETLSAKGNYDLRLPTDKMQLFMANKYQILNESVQLLLNGDVVPDFKTTYPSRRSKKNIKH